MTSLESYAGQTPASVSNRKLKRTPLVFVMILLGVSYMFNAMDRQVFPALLGSIRSDYGLTLPEAGFVSTVFTVNVAIAADHQLIDTGPYRWLRHPAYTGALLAFLGLGLCSQNWASLALIVIGTTAAFSYRMHVEELALTGAFGERYRQYMQRTWRLVPGLY